MRRSEEHEKRAASLAYSHTKSIDFPLGKDWHELTAVEQVKFLEMAWQEMYGNKTIEHNHYYKNVSHLELIDVYRVLELFEVTDPCIQHSVKKLLVAGGRGAGKSKTKDIKEAIESLERWQIMEKENGNLG